jgi:hypothetical protein
VKIFVHPSVPLPVQNYNVTRVHGSWYFEWRGGDVVRPFGWDNWAWFGREEDKIVPFPRNVLRIFIPWRILPFITWGSGVVPFSNGGYLGFKAFGVDNEEYKNWLPASEVYDGSVALCPSFRFSIKS